MRPTAFAPHRLLPAAILAGLGSLFAVGSLAAHPLEVGDPSYGRLREVIFPSPSYGDVTLLVYTPPNYFAQGDGRRFPVVYWLHGSGGNHLQLESTLNALPVAGAGAAAKLDTLIGSGQIPPLLMVGVNSPNGVWDAANLALITRELPAFVDASYRTVAKRSGRGIEGFSLGSQGLSIYATARPDLFASISLLGGAFLSANWTAAAPSLLRDGAEVYLTVGDADGFFPQSASFDAQLTQLGIAHTFAVVPGAVHSNTQLYAARGIDILRWHGARFAATARLDAGPDVLRQGSLAPPLTLTGVVADPEGTLGPSPAFAWSQADGPAAATIDSPASLSTDVHLPVAGAYHFRLEAQGLVTIADVVELRAYDLAAGLALHLPLEGSLADASGNGRNATAGGGPTADPAGRYGAALAFDGVDDQLTVPDFNYGPAFSVALWLKPADLAGSSFYYVFSHNGFDTVSSCNLYLPQDSAAFGDPESGPAAPLPAPLSGGSGRLRLAIRDGVGDLSGQAVTGTVTGLDDGRWHHAALVVGPGTGNRLYYDGVQVAAGANGGDTYNPSTALFFAARSVSPDGRYFRGSLDDIKLYDRPLLADELTLLAAPPEAANGAPVVAAGGDRTVYLGAPLLLQGLAADPTPTGLLSLGWSKISGPGAATFADPGAPETSAVFSKKGAYVLRLSAGDGLLTASDELNVTVAAENTPGLVAQWTLDETTGTQAADRSGLAHHGQLAGAPLWTSPAHVGPGGLRFNPANGDLVAVDASPVLDFAPAEDSFTLAAWLRLAPGKTGTIVARGATDPVGRSFHLFVGDLGNDGRSDLQAIVGGLANNSGAGQGPRFDDDAWHHVALAHDASSHQNRLYLDGAPIGNATASGNARAADSGLLLGARRVSADTGAAQILDGELDDVRIYSRALAPAEIQLLFTGPPIPSCGPPSCLFGDGFELGSTSAWQ